MEENLYISINRHKENVRKHILQQLFQKYPKPKAQKHEGNCHFEKSRLNEPVSINNKNGFSEHSSLKVTPSNLLMVALNKIL